MKRINLPRYQKGLATLVISSVVLFSVTSISLYSAKSTILDQKISANAARAKQALTSADGAMNFIASFYDQNGSTPDSAATTQLASDINGNPTLDSFTNVNGRINVAVSGNSDDSTSTRTINQQLSQVPISGNGINQPLITKGGVGVGGNVTVVNRHSNITVWSGEKVNIGSGSGGNTSGETRILTPGTNTSAFTRADYIGVSNGGNYSNPSTANTTSASSSTAGNHIDIIDQDTTLSLLSSDEFFENFFNETKTAVKKMAQSSGLYTTTVSAIEDESGLIWLGNGSGDISVGVDVGSWDKPAVLIIEAGSGNEVTFSGVTIFGTVYVIGNFRGSGGPTFYGSVVLDGNVLQTNGNTTIIYDEDALNPDSPLTGMTSSISGTWRDF